MKQFLLLSCLFVVRLYADGYEIVDYVASLDRSAVIAMISQDLELLNYQDVDEVIKYVDMIDQTSTHFFKVMRVAGDVVGRRRGRACCS